MKFYLCRLCPSYKVVEHQAHNLETEGLNPASGTGRDKVFCLYLCGWGKNKLECLFLLIFFSLV